MPCAAPAPLCTIIEQFENSLRKHNHLGLIHALLVELAKKGGLDAAVTGAKAKMQERRAKARATGQMEED